MDRTRTRLEQALAWILVINATLGLLAGGLSAWQGGLPWVSLLGLVAGLASLRAIAVGPWLGALYYSLLLASYHGSSGSYGLRSGISLAWVIALPEGVLVLNVVAWVLLAATAVWLTRQHASRWSPVRAGHGSEPVAQLQDKRPPNPKTPGTPDEQR
jgi:hypothetical protein